MLFLVLLLSFPLLLLFFLQKHRTTSKPTRLPGPSGLPIVGNLLQLNNPALYLTLWQLSQKYGPLFSLQLGVRPTLVVSSPKLAKEVMKTHDLEFCTRPSLLSQQRLSYNGLDITFSPYNDHWREIRKLCVVHLFNSKRVTNFSSIRQFEVKQMITKISGHASSLKVTNLNETLMSLASTLICRSAFGRKYEEEGIERSRFHGLLNELQALIATFFVTDYLPFLGWIDKLTGLIGRLERNFKELDEFYQEVIDEHLDPKQQIKPEEEDMIDVLLQLKKQRWISIDLTLNHIKAVIMDLLAAATDTSAATSVWVMTALMKNPRVMKKVQEEVRNLYGKKGFIDEDDIENLPYLKAVIKETLRLYPPVLLIPRETNKECIIDGYEIPAKTLVFVNVWAIHRDPEAWKDPDGFYPERFLDSAIDFKGQDFELIPFGGGRRICPGLIMGVANVELIVANLVYSFDWEMPVGMKRDDIDTEVLPGLAQHKKNPLCLVAKNPM